MENFINELEEKLRAVIENFNRSITAIRGARPTPRLLEDIKVNYYDQLLPLKQLGSLSIVPPREVDVDLWDKSIIKAAVKAINEANLGLSVTDDSKLIRAILPSLTEERRKEYIKLVSKIAEEAKIQVRKERDEINKKVKTEEKEKKLGEDQKFKLLEKIQETVDEANKKILTAVEAKNKELMEE